MTPAPHTIGADQPVTKAQEMLRLYEIRHLPVLRAGKLDGIITERDVALIERLELNIDRLRVEDAMTTDVYEVSPTTSLAEVARVMAERKLGSAVVVEHAKVTGILTTVDVCAALAALLTKP